jgi:hypothetical protein
MPDMGMYGSEKDVAAFITRTFALLPSPVLVGLDRRVASPHHRFVRDCLAGRDDALIAAPEGLDLIRDAAPSRKDAVAAYAGRLSDGSTVYLAIPRQRFEPFKGRHNDSIFCRGVRVLDHPKEFLGDGFAFLTALLDSQTLKVKVTRDGVITDDGLAGVKTEVMDHALRFLERLAADRPAVLAEALRTHSQLLIGEALENPRLIDLLRRHYPFEAANARGVRWADLRRVIRPTRPGGPPTLYYLPDPRARAQMAAYLDRGHQVVIAGPTEVQLLERLAAPDGVELVDVINVPGGDVIPPPTVQDLVARLTPYLHDQGVADVEFVRNPQENAPPATFRVRQIATGGSRRSALLARADGDEPGGIQIMVEALQLNISHRLVTELAGRVGDLREDALTRAAEVLFEVATLNSPFEGVRHRITPRVCQSLIDGLIRELGAYVARTTAVHAQCFVAMPYRPEFETVWAGLRGVLEADPYRWTLVRADHAVLPVGLLNGLMANLGVSERFIAELSFDGGGWNPNVLLELGMMLQKKKEDTLILADDETVKALPVDLRGEVLATYPKGLRKDPAGFAAWFKAEVVKHKHFAALFGPGAGR